MNSVDCEVIYFHQLNRANLKEFETYLRDKQLSWNTVSTYMRTLRATYNKAVDKKIITENSRLFHHVYTGVKNDIKRALEVEDLISATLLSSHDTTVFLRFS